MPVLNRVAVAFASSYKNAFGFCDGTTWKNVQFEDGRGNNCTVYTSSEFGILGGDRIVAIASGCRSDPLIYDGSSHWDTVNALVSANKLYLGALNGTFWTQNEFQISSHYVSYFNGTTMKYYGVQDSLRYSPTKIITDSTGAWFTFSSNYDGVILSRFDGTAFKNYYSINGRTSPVSDVVLLSTGRALAIWKGNRPGISLYDNGSWNDIYDRIGIVGDVVQTHDVVWFAQTDKGIARWNFTTDSVTFFNKSNGKIPSDSIFRFCIDKSGNFWYSPKITLVRIARNTSSTSVIINESIADSDKQFKIAGNELRYTNPFAYKIADPVLSVYTLSGRRVLSMKMLKGANADWIFTGLNSFPSGIFIAKIDITGDGSQREKFLIKR